MKFKSQRTGHIYTNMRVAMAAKCDGNCGGCCINEHVRDYVASKNPCLDYCLDNPVEAARLMGYELVDDHSPDPTKKVDAQQNPLQYIFDTFGRDEILAQAAEEATELAQALLKLRRAYRGTTPVSVEDALEQVREEHNDLTLCMDVLLSCNDEPIGDTGVIRYEKLERWVQRAKKYEKRGETE